MGAVLEHAATAEAGDAGTVSRSLNRDEKRATALAKLLAKVEAAGGQVTITGASLADELGLPLVTVRAWLGRWTKEGAIRTQSAGPHGTVVRVGGARGTARGVAGRAAPGAARKEVEARARRAPVTGPTVFCVWCGAQSKYQGARFCSSCGKELPRS